MNILDIHSKKSTNDIWLIVPVNQLNCYEILPVDDCNSKQYQFQPVFPYIIIIALGLWTVNGENSFASIFS